MKCRNSSLSSCYVAAPSSALHQPCLDTSSPLSCSILFQPFLDAPSQALFSASLVAKKRGEIQVLLQNTFCCKYMCQEAGLHMKHGSFSFSQLSLHFHILSHLEPGCTHRCGEHFCWLSLNCPHPPPFSTHTYTHKKLVSRFFSVTFCRLTKSLNGCFGWKLHLDISICAGV